jgi:hypothetical protein
MLTGIVLCSSFSLDAVFEMGYSHTNIIFFAGTWKVIS